MVLVLQLSVLACAVYVSIVYAMYLGLMFVGLQENRLRKRERVVDDLGAVSDTRFAPPVSIILPAYNESSGIAAAALSLLGLDYPEFEVILVDDGSTDGTIGLLREELDLVPVEVLSRDVVPTERVNGLYRSATYPHLLVVDKRNGGKADALNAGLNYSRYAFVCGVDADMVFARDALMSTMRAFMTDPRHVVGLTSFIEIAANPATAIRHGVGLELPDARPLILYQALDYVRSFYNNRIAWSRLGWMLCAIGGFQVWRRDLLDELHGWSRAFTCEDIEITFRVHQVLRERGRPYRILCLPIRVGVTEGPDTMRKLVAQRERWQRVIIETWWAYRGMCFNRRYGSVGFMGMPFYLLSELLAPFFEVLSILTLVAGAALGLMDWEFALLIFLLITLVNSVIAAGSVLMVERQSHGYRLAGLGWLLLLLPLELVLYRPILSWARIKGTYRFLRGDKAWHKFERNVRTEAA